MQRLLQFAGTDPEQEEERIRGKKRWHSEAAPICGIGSRGQGEMECRDACSYLGEWSPGKDKKKMECRGADGFLQGKHGRLSLRQMQNV